MKRKLKHYYSVLVFSGLLSTWYLCGCSVFPKSTKTVSYEQFLRAAKPNIEQSLICSSYYCGSKDSFDYFVVFPPLGSAFKYRISEQESPMTNRFGFTKDRESWRIWPPRQNVPNHFPVSEVTASNINAMPPTYPLLQNQILVDGLTNKSLLKPTSAW